MAGIPLAFPAFFLYGKHHAFEKNMLPSGDSMRTFPRLITLALAALLAVSAAGCAQVHNAYKSSKNFYHTHINRPEKLNMDTDEVLLKSPEQTLVKRVMPIDEELSRLEKALDALASPPDAEAASAFLSRFPWLTGLYMVAPDGTLGAAVPGAPLKQLDFSPLLTVQPKTLPRDLRSSVQDSPFGPEILVARPFLQEDQLVVILVAAFDFRALLPFTTAPGDLVVRSPETLLWSGDIDYASTPMAGIDWKKHLESHTDGIISKDKKSMLWVTRHIAETPIVFAAFME